MVEYAWGDAASTEWGALRALDGHPAPYRVTAVEVGNEEKLGPNMCARVAAVAAAMDARSDAIAAPKFRQGLADIRQLPATSSARL